jgi:hypothetical protein
MPLRGDATARLLGAAGERQHVARDTRATAVAHDPPLDELRGRRVAALPSAPVEVTAIHDHHDFVVVAVVLDELRVERVG